MTDNAEIGLDTFIWVYDPNLRVYRKDKDGNYYGGPIERHCWRRCKIVKETRVSVMISFGKGKIPKKDLPNRPDICFSQEEADSRAWIAENRHGIAESVRQAKDYDLLRKIAEMVGYQEPPDR